MIHKRYEFKGYCNFITSVMPGQHYLTRYTRVLKTKILSLDLNDKTLIDFLQKWDTVNYLKSCSLMRFTEKKYASHGIVLNDESISNMFIDFIRQYDSINDAEEDDFKRVWRKTPILITKKINDRECIIKLMNDRAYWWSNINGEILEPLSTEEINQYNLKPYLNQTT